jgi:hypothetical protein
MTDKNNHLFDTSGNVQIIVRALTLVCLCLIGLDFVIHRHTVHSWENIHGFYALYGFVGCVILVLIAKWMRSFLMRSEEYYDRDELKGLQRNDNVDD